jgi:hemoglobin
MLLSLVLGGCASKQSAGSASTTPAAPATLYSRLGGRPAIKAVVDEFVDRVAADKRINMRFLNTDIPKLRVLLTDFVCTATGGPEKYEGRDMHASHGGMQLVDDEFNALVEDLAGALDKFKVPAREKGELLGALGPLKPQIVNPPPPAAAKHDPALAAKGTQMVERLRKSGRGKTADILEVALTARKRGQRNYAEQLFSAVELEGGFGEFKALDPLFRGGAPARVTGRVKTMPKDTPPQPKLSVGGSDEDDPDQKPKKGALSGVLKLDGGPLGGRAGVITLQPATGRSPRRSPKQRVIEQRDREFAPHVMMVPVGSTVAFPNFDPVFHNVFSVSPTKAFDLGIYKNGESREVTFDKEGILRIGCNLHANMSAFLVVVAAPHYVVTKPDGKFRFRALQPGKYKLRAWTDGATEPVTQMIEIADGENNVVVTAHAGAAADLGTDKFGVPRGAAATPQ